LSEASGLQFNSDFVVGYSPERINPGDKTRHLPDIVKITSGSNEAASLFIDRLYSSIITAGTHRAESIKVAEASKVIENVQRDINIALMNEFSGIFDSLFINTADVLKAAETKWNFMPFKPGLVGGHCIGVDPFYLIHKANKIGAESDLMKAARKINENVPAFIVRKLVKHCSLKNIQLDKAKVLILGCSFKEDCPDIRNSKVMSLYSLASEWFPSVEIEDEVVAAEEVMRDYGFEINKTKGEIFDIVVLAVPHRYIMDKGADGIKSRLSKDGIFFDVKSAFPAVLSDLRL
jgi:UDP-N-acetyl-D-galactosamine dehydrogenase